MSQALYNKHSIPRMPFGKEGFLLTNLPQKAGHTSILIYLPQNSNNNVTIGLFCFPPLYYVFWWMYL